MKRIYYLNNLLSWWLSLFIAAFFMALALSAQQSCYEQYLRAHNMPLPTDSMVMDDSYDELKKEVIARQLMRNERTSVSQPIRQPIFLAIDTLAGTCHLLAQDGTILADVHLAMVDSTWYMWLSVDPLADKYPGNTPYLYCNGNPIMFIDPDGRDWYVATDEDGNKQYRFNEDVVSQESLEQMGINGTYLGQTYVSDTYYLGLFGNYAKKNSPEGHLLSKIDQLILADIDYSIESSNLQQSTNMEPKQTPKVIFDIPNVSTSGKEFLYCGGKGVFYPVKENKGYIASYPTQKVTRGGGFNASTYYPLVVKNNCGYGYDFLVIKFTKSAAINFMRQYEKYYHRVQTNGR